MAQKFKWKVIREHTGDRFYPEGDTRVGTKADVGHLEGKLLELVGPADEEPADSKSGADISSSPDLTVPTGEKADPIHLNKAEPAAPANKAVSPRASKAK
jgi:hypothetical protein